MPGNSSPSTFPRAGQCLGSHLTGDSKSLFVQAFLPCILTEWASEGLKF